ncbi:MAG: S8 family peptidase [Gordonibacter sp.]|uniref:S8 family peptidase n=1 Tax=Gordonibacter sp. TaxID=1968902 RepID=UPI002FC8BC15
MPRYDNIFLTDITDTFNFTTSPSGGAQPNIPTRRNRQVHSSNLTTQFRAAQDQFNAYTPRQVAAIAYNTGTYLEFSGANNCDLITKSLEDNRQGIKLLNVRDIVSQNEDGTSSIVTKATVFIPSGKEAVFIKKIADFATLQTKTGKPKNNDLVSSIESISNALKISAFWVGRPSDAPSDVAQWFELWVDVKEDTFETTKNNLFSLLDNLGIAHRSEEQYIRFPERLVIPVYANQSSLLDLIKQGVTIAEIRKPADPNSTFIDSSLVEQAEWADDLLARTHFNDTGIAICILDTGINGNHSLIDPYMPTTGMTVNTQWGTADHSGHGTNMAGVALYNDLKRYLISNTPVTLNHTLESVKILGNTPNAQGLYGYITEQATLLPEISTPTSRRIYCMAVTDDKSSLNNGQPSSWSGAIDQISHDKQKRLFIVSAGNVTNQEMQNSGYPNACLTKSVHDPAQAWNALSVGAYSADTTIQPDPTMNGYSALAKEGELSPFSSTSHTWKSQWPIKPELICDGGNVAFDGTNYTSHDDLSKLTLHNDISNRLFDTINATSAATAQCSYIAAELLAAYPDLHPETVRALLIHSARWTDGMKNQFGLPDIKTQGRRNLLRTCGYGVPDLMRAKDTLNNRVNMIIEGEIQPYEKITGSIPKTKEMHLHSLPWPNEVLQTLENEPVKLRVTLSYFIEPGPGQKGWKYKYRYASHGLRFDIKRPNETTTQFQQRINAAMREEDYQTTASENNWYLGSNNRDVGSLHSDVWEDTAINLAQSGTIAVYPIIGWWRERTNLKKMNSKTRYSLVISIEAADTQIDLYTPIMTKIAQRIAVPIQPQ